MARIGIDIDGVLANFTPTYIELIKAVTGEDRFADPPVIDTWTFERKVGYTAAQLDLVWRTIKRDRNFWLSLPSMPQADEAIKALDTLRIDGHDIYFITARSGVRAKWQSEVWLEERGMMCPTVILSEQKGACVNLLGLDAYIDDRDLNVNDVMRTVRAKEMLTRVYWFDASYRDHPIEEGVKTVKSVQDMLKAEELV